MRIAGRECTATAMSLLFVALTIKSSPISRAQDPKPQVPSAPPTSTQAEQSKFVQYRRNFTKGTLSSALKKDHEEAGIIFETHPMLDGIQNEYSGIYIRHVVYPTSTVRLRVPPAAQDEQILYAATSRPPNGSCLEVGTAYVTEPHATVTNTVLYVYNFCKAGGGDFEIPPTLQKGRIVDLSFMDKYVAVKALDLPAYELRIFTRDYPLTDSSTWYAQIHNQKTNDWETLFQAKGIADDLRGWSIFETYYQPGLCSEALPLIGADQISLLRKGSTDTPELAGATMPPLTVRFHDGKSEKYNCFVDDSTGLASYQVLPAPPVYYQWSVSSKQ
jgi:hypothetical protein